MAGVNIATAYLSIIPTVEGMQGNLGRIFEPAEAEADAAGGRSGAKFAVAAGAAIVAAAAAVTVGVKKLYDVGSIFDDVSDTIRAGTGQSGAALEELSGIAKTVATQIPTSFEQASQTVTQVTQRLGLTGDKLEVVSEQFIQAGNVLGQDVDISSATKALSVFGVQGDAVSGQLDTLFRVSQSTGVGINELTAAAAAQAPALQELGFNLDQTASLIGSLDKAGLNSTAITASMGKGLVKLAKDGEAPQEAYQRIVGQLDELVKSGDNAAAIDLAAGIFGTKGATQFVGAIQSGTLSMENLSAAAAGTGDTILGVGKETADAAESWTLFKNKATAALQPVGDAVFGLAGDAMVKLTDSFDPAIAKAQAFFSVVASGEGYGDIGGPDSFLGKFATTLYGLGETLGDVVGPMIKDTFAQIMPIFQQVGAVLGPAFVQVFETLKPAVAQLLPLVTQLLPVFNPVSLIFKALLPVLPQIADMVGKLANVLATFVAGALTSLAPLFQKVVDVINRLLPFITQLITSLLPPLMSLFDKLAPLLDAVLQALLPVVDAIIDALIPAIDALMPVVELVFTFIRNTIENVMKYIGGIIDVLTGVFTGDWDKVWTGIQEIFGAVWAQIQNVFTSVIDIITEIFTNLGPKLNEIINNLLNTVIGWGVSLLTWLWDGIKSVSGQVYDWFAQFPGMAWAGIVALAGVIGGYGVDFIMWIKDGIVNGATSIFNWFTGLPEQIGTLITNVGSKLLQLGKDLVGWIVQGVAEVAGDIWAAITQALTGGTPEVNGKGGVTFGPFGTTLSGGARGAVVPGTDPGRRDNVLARLPSGQLFGLRSEEAIMVPEFTRSVGGESGVHALNRLAESGQLGDVLGGFAGGGVVPLDAMRNRARAWGGELAWAKAAEVVGELKKPGGGFSSNGNWGPVNMNGFAANTAAAKAYIESHFSGVSSIGGLYGGSVSGSDHPFGKALDVMIANYKSSQGIAAGDAIADWFYNNANAFGTKYEIWRDRIRDPGGPWKPYQHPGGNDDTLQHRDHVHLSFLTGDGAFTGQPVGDSAALGGQFGALVSKVRDKLGIGSGFGSFGLGSNGGGVEQWRGLGLDVLGKVGAYKGLSLTGYIDKMMNQIRTESSGDPNAINTTDINAQRGDPSIGLLQVIGSTFRNALQGTPFADLIAAGQRDPRASLTASTLYSLGRYGSLDKAWRGVAYDNGGWLQPGSQGVNFLTKPEAVLTPPQSDALLTHAKALEAGFNGQIPPMKIYIGNEQVKEIVRVEIDADWDSGPSDFARVGAQS